MSGPSAPMAAAASAVERLGPWFHNLQLPDGTETAPDHPLGDFPRCKWRQIEAAVPQALDGWTALDIGCNAGFYSFELARRGAAVTALDIDARYLSQARWAARAFGLDGRIEFREGEVYGLAGSAHAYDLVWFTGVVYHLRYPVLALDIVRALTGRLLMFQTLTLPAPPPEPAPADIRLADKGIMAAPAWPRMAFVENRLAGDPTNWWVANDACVEALLRTAGLRILDRPGPEFWLCAPVERPCRSEYERVCRAFGA